MKKLFLLVVLGFLATTITSASTKHITADTPFVFIENGIEFAIFKNGDFDFTILNSRNYRAQLNTSSVNISFNSGRNYNPYIQRNRYGDIVQIENTPINYDYHRRVNRIGSIPIMYNTFGYVHAIGNLNIHYNTYGHQYACTGFINKINHTYKPIYTQYRRPVVVSHRKHLGGKTVNQQHLQTSKHSIHQPYQNNHTVKRNSHKNRVKSTHTKHSTYSYRR